MIDESFSMGSTLFHKRDPKVKLIGAAAISIVLALCSSIIVAGVGVIVTAILLSFSKPALFVLKTLSASQHFYSFYLDNSPSHLWRRRNDAIVISESEP